MGWTISGNFENRPAKYIVIVMPHTANMDFFIGVFSRSILRISEAKYLGKSQLFRWPYGFIFRLLGGYPVDRTKDNNLVDAVVRIFNEKEKFAIALAPEGTRTKVDRLKTGFYYIARKAAIPIIPVAFDYSRKQVVIGDNFYCTDDMRQDFKNLLDFYKDKKGKFPEKGIDESILKKTVTS